jgi:predicted acylesterase/phospholipase RssA
MKYLIIGPGGMGFFMILGYLKKIEHELKEVEEISGSSAGAILGFFLAIGKSLNEILNFSINIDMESHLKMNLKSLLKNFGLVDTTSIKEALVKFAGGSPKFKDLDIKFHVAAMCVNTSSTFYFSRDTHPEMEVIDAVCASLSIPLLFAAFKYQDKLYIDGGTLEEAPAFPFLNKNGEDVFCIQLKMRRPVFGEVTDIKTYLKNIVTAGFLSRISYPHIRRVLLDFKDYDVLNLKLPVEDRLRLYLMGQS